MRHTRRGFFGLSVFGALAAAIPWPLRRLLGGERIRVGPRDTIHIKDGFIGFAVGESGEPDRPFTLYMKWAVNDGPWQQVKLVSNEPHDVWTICDGFKIRLHGPQILLDTDALISTRGWDVPCC